MKSVICRDCSMKSFFKICFTFVFHLEKEMKTANKVIMMMTPVKNLTNEKSSKTKKLIWSAHHPCRMSSASAWVQPSCDEEMQLKLTGKKKSGVIHNSLTKTAHVRKDPLIRALYLSGSRDGHAWWFPRWDGPRHPHTSSSRWRASTALACSGPARHTGACMNQSCWVQVLPPPGIWSWW